MFGEYAVYFDKKTVAFVCDNTFYLKINTSSTEEAKKLMLNFKMGQAYPGSKDYYIVDEDVFENRKVFLGLLEKCAESVLEKKPKKK